MVKAVGESWSSRVVCRRATRAPPTAPRRTSSRRRRRRLSPTRCAGAQAGSAARHRGVSWRSREPAFLEVMDRPGRRFVCIPRVGPGELCGMIPAHSFPRRHRVTSRRRNLGDVLRWKTAWPPNTPLRTALIPDPLNAGVEELWKTCTPGARHDIDAFIGSSARRSASGSCPQRTTGRTLHAGVPAAPGEESAQVSSTHKRGHARATPGA